MKRTLSFSSLILLSLLLVPGLAQAKSDLMTSSFHVSPTTSVPGGTITVKCYIYNNGTTAISTPFKVGFYYSTDSTITTTDTQLSTFTLNGIGSYTQIPISGGNLTLTLPGNVPAGNAWIGVFIDYENKLTETSKSNNAPSMPITITIPKPDLTPTVLSVSPTSASPGDSVTVTYGIKNRGVGAATSAFNIGVYYSSDSVISTGDVKVATVAVSSLAVGATFPSSGSGTISAKLPAGISGTKGWVGLFVDDGGKISESVETNNTKDFAITVVQLSANGVACTGPGTCASGSCVDGVCCNSACGGGVTTDCQACSKAAGAAADGTCSPRAKGTTCRASAGTCDAAETCDGTATACPADTYQPATTTCRASAGACDKAELCSGASNACPADTYQPATTTCRAASGECDLSETCSGIAATCPKDVYKIDGVSCSSGSGSCKTGKCLLNPAAGVPDLGPDMGPDAGADASMEAGADASMEAGADASMEAGADASMEAGADASMEAGADASAADMGSDGATPQDASSPADAGGVKDEGSGSCDCTTANDTSPVHLPWLLMVAVLLLRRRREA